MLIGYSFQAHRHQTLVAEIDNTRQTVLCVVTLRYKFNLFFVSHNNHINNSNDNNLYKLRS